MPETASGIPFAVSAVTSPPWLVPTKSTPPSVTSSRADTAEITALRSATSEKMVISLTLPSLFEELLPPQKSNVQATYPLSAKPLAYAAREFPVRNALCDKITAGCEASSSFGKYNLQ